MWCERDGGVNKQDKGRRPVGLSTKSLLRYVARPRQGPSDEMKSILFQRRRGEYEVASRI